MSNYNLDRIYAWWDDEYDVGVFVKSSHKSLAAPEAVEYMHSDFVNPAIIEAAVSLLAEERGWVRHTQLKVAEEKIAKAVTMLKELATCVDDGCYCSEAKMAGVMDKTRAVLAELGQGT
jgi:hypothetical protein